MGSCSSEWADFVGGRWCGLGRLPHFWCGLGPAEVRGRFPWGWWVYSVHGIVSRYRIQAWSFGTLTFLSSGSLRSHAGRTVEWPFDDLIQFWVILRKRVGGSKISLLSAATAQKTGVNKSISFARWQQGRGLLCLAPQLVIPASCEQWCRPETKIWSEDAFLADHTIGCAYGTVCHLSVDGRLSVTFCILAKRLDRFAWNFQGRCGVTMGRPDCILGQFG